MLLRDTMYGWDVVKAFFRRSTGERSWFSLLQLEVLSSTDAFDCTERDMVIFEIQKVKKWKQGGRDIVGIKAGDDNMLLKTVTQILDTLDRSLFVYNKPDNFSERRFCIFCSNNSQGQELLTCSLGGTSHATTQICPCCQIIKNGKISRLKNDAKRPELDKLMELLSDADKLCVEVVEKAIINQIIEKALAFKACLIKNVDFSLDYLGEEPSIVIRKLSTSLKAVEVAGVYDRESNCKFELALARNSWRVRASKLLKGSQKPSIHQIQRLIKEGLTINVPLEDYFWHRLKTIKNVGLQWAMKAKEVSSDSGALELHIAFELIAKGENLPVHFDRELKLLRERSMLYCICRKPYGQRPMIACDKCDEWLNGQYEEPQTPSPRPTERSSSNSSRKIAENNDIRRHSGIELLLRRNRKPFRRVAKKRIKLHIFSPFFHVH